MLKTWIRRIHLALAMLVGLLLLNLSITGALLLYAKDIQAFINPKFWLIPKAIYLHNSVLPLSKLVDEIELATKSKIKFIQQEEMPHKVWLISLSNGKYLNINPYSAEILLQHSYYDTFYGFIMSWHRWLLYKSESDNKPLKVWISVASLILIIEILLGCYLWLKPKHRLKRLKIKWRSKPKVLYYQLHTTLGVLTAIPLILIAFSGMAFHWQFATKQIIELLSFSKIESVSYKATLATDNTKPQLNQAYYIGSSALKDSKVFRVYLPQKQGEPLKLRLKMPSESHGYSWSWVDPNTAKLLKTFNASDTSLATRIWNFKYKFHIGEFIGWPIKILWLIISLLPTFFIFSGLYLLLNRKNTPKSNKAATSI